MNMEKQAKKLMKSAKSNWSKAKRTYVCRSLKELIKAYRACTTRSEERALVKKEAAHIRDLFREGDKAFRRRNIAKLLFFHMNGYPTDFGMTECIKLCASSKYNDKRVAYLGLMILVDETEDILMLMTNCLKQDLHSAELQIVSLALNVLGDIASAEMVRDLLPEIEKHLLSPNPYIRKKAGLAAVRAARKLPPEETSTILAEVPAMFDIKSPAVHISAAALVTALCGQSSENIPTLQGSLTPVLLDILREHLLAKKKGATDPVRGGVRNPFLQVKVLHALRLMMRSGIPSQYVEDVSDVLAQVASNTDSTKIAGCAVLYECIRTITSLDVDPNLRAMAVNILGRFLTHKEPTVRYIALQELTGVVDADGPNVLANMEGSKEKVIAGLREADPTVRKRAVELMYRMANESNVKEVVTEMLGYIKKSDLPEPKEDGCWKTFLLLDRLGSSDIWKIETFVKTLDAADMHMPEELITSFIAMVSSKPQVQSHAVLQLFNLALSSSNSSSGQPAGEHDLFGDQEQEPKAESISKPFGPSKRKPKLERVALYILGEHGAAALQAGLNAPVVIDAFERMLVASEAVEETWLDSRSSDFHSENQVLGEVALTGLVKFACRAMGNTPNTGTGLDPLLTLPAPNDANKSNPSDSILALTAPPARESKADEAGLGSDLLESMGLGPNKPAPSTKALVPTANELVEQPLFSGSLMSMEPEHETGGANPIVDRVRRILLARVRDGSLEVQQRACEYLMLLNESLTSALLSAMAPMPSLDFQKIRERARLRKELRSSQMYTESSNAGGLLLDLLGDGTDATAQPLALPSPDSDLLALPPSEAETQAGLSLEDIMGGMSVSQQDKTPTANADAIAVQKITNGATHREPFPGGSKTPQLGGGAVHATNLFESEALVAHAEFFKDEDNSEKTRIELQFRNQSNDEMQDFVFLLAVPKYIQLQMHPASDSTIKAGEYATQVVNLVNSLDGQKPVQLRYRVEYTNATSGEVVQAQGVARDLGGL